MPILIVVAGRRYHGINPEDFDSSTAKEVQNNEFMDPVEKYFGHYGTGRINFILDLGEARQARIRNENGSKGAAKTPGTIIRQLAAWNRWEVSFCLTVYIISVVN